MNRVQFGVYSGGKLKIPFGAPVEVTNERAELIATILEDGVKDTLLPDDYVAYDYV